MAIVVWDPPRRARPVLIPAGVTRLQLRPVGGAIGVLVCAAVAVAAVAAVAAVVASPIVPRMAMPTANSNPDRAKAISPRLISREVCGA